MTEHDNSESVAHHANILVSLGRTSEALAILEPAIARWPDDAYLWCHLSRTLLQHSLDGERPLRAAERAIELSPEYEWAHRLRSISLARNGEIQKAEAAARTAINVEPHSPYAHSRLAALLSVDSHRTDEAIKHALITIELAPDDPESYAQLARIYSYLKQWNDVETYALSALTIDPHHVEALMLLAEARTELGLIADAATTYRLVFSIDPRQASFEIKHKSIFKYLEIEEKLAEVASPDEASKLISEIKYSYPLGALTLLNTVNEKWPEDALIWNELSYVLTSLNKGEEAVLAADKVMYYGNRIQRLSACFSRNNALNKTNRWPSIRLILRKIESDENVWNDYPYLRELFTQQPTQLDEALHTATSNLVSDDSNLNKINHSYDELVKALAIERNRVDQQELRWQYQDIDRELKFDAVAKALSHLEPLLKKQPENIKVRMRLAQALVQSGLIEHGLKEVECLVNIDKNDAQLHRLHSLALELSDKLTESEGAARRALSLAPDNWLNYHRLAYILGGPLNQTSEAMAVTHEALTLFPEEPQLHIQLARFKIKTDSWAEAEQHLLDAQQFVNFSSTVSSLLNILKYLPGNVDELRKSAWPPRSQIRYPKVLLKYKEGLADFSDWQQSQEAHQTLVEYLKEKKLIEHCYL